MQLASATLTTIIDKA